VIDACYRVAFRLAYPLARLWWRLRGNTGITLAVWVGDRVLLVRHSYKPGLRLPGGSVRSGEDHCLAAGRELQEEVGLAAAVNDLHLVGRFQNTYGPNYLYEIELTVEPKLTVDRREIVSACFAAPELALERNQPLRSYLQTRRPPGASPQTPPAGERAEVETMSRRLEELRRAASNSVLRDTYQVAIEALDAVVYRLGMLRALEAPARHQTPGPITSPAPAAKPAPRVRAAAARIGAARKPRR
jgi:ADP-ribose pyrophosphatase YjhB (NUDIX family)